MIGTSPFAAGLLGSTAGFAALTGLGRVLRGREKLIGAAGAGTGGGGGASRKGLTNSVTLGDISSSGDGARTALFKGKV
jgi:hypothetical protein